MHVTQHVLAFHPQKRQLRTASLLTAYGNQYHVQYHNANLGVHMQRDTTMIPIGPSDLHKQIEVPEELQPEQQLSEVEKVKVNQTRNKLLLSQQMPGNHALIQSLMGQAQEGNRKQAFLPVEQTEYTGENRKAMALLLMLVER